MKLKNIDNEVFLHNVKKAMQPMEELGGPDREDYLEIMKSLKQDIEERIENCQNLASEQSDEG